MYGKRGMGVREEGNENMECSLSTWDHEHIRAHRVHLLNHNLDHDVLVLDVHDGSHCLPLRPHQGRAKHDP